MSELSISLIIPVFNETETVESLIASINGQILQPDEIIWIDGGSSDGTPDLIQTLVKNDPRHIVKRVGRAYPGKGRNIGAQLATSRWLAFTDAGIMLDNNWLNNLVISASRYREAQVVYGNYHPITKSFFEKCASIAYVNFLPKDQIRGKFIASSLILKDVWEKSGGFPNWRAAEDLDFMERVNSAGIIEAYAPQAHVYWKLRQGLVSTFKRFDLYSKYNVWAGRQAQWHYGIGRQYLLILPFLFLGIFYNSWWLILILFWIFLRVGKRMLAWRKELGNGILYDLRKWLMVIIITLVIDVATFSGWVKAILKPSPIKQFSKS